MAARYKPQPPESYPAAWHAAVKIARIRQGCATGPQWVFVEEVSTRSAGVNRMKRLRAFRDAIGMGKGAPAQLCFRLQGPEDGLWWVEMRAARGGWDLINAELIKGGQHED